MSVAPISPDIIAMLEYKVQEYETESFILHDPISIPKLFAVAQDIEIAGFFAAILAWGNRTTIIRNARRLMSLMDDAPYQFIMQHDEQDLRKFLSFVHRTFNATDLLYTISFFRHHYSQHDSLYEAFFAREQMSVAEALVHFHEYFFSMPTVSLRTKKHISTPAKHSACKRLNMFLRWMIRQGSPVDFGIWKAVSPSTLMIPLDVHTGNVSRRLGLLTRKQNDWKAVVELTEKLRNINAQDPARYDYALYALGAEERYR